MAIIKTITLGKIHSLFKESQTSENSVKLLLLALIVQMLEEPTSWYYDPALVI